MLIKVEDGKTLTGYFYKDFLVYFNAKMAYFVPKVQVFCTTVQLEA